LEDDEFGIVAYLTHVVGLCFEARNVAEPILACFASLVVDVLIAQYPDVIFSGDETTLRRIISSFTAPSRNGDNDKAVIVCHWPPLSPEEKKRHERLRDNNRNGSNKRKRDNTAASIASGDSSRHVDIFQAPLEFRRTTDIPQYSMEVLWELVPDTANCRVVDIYTQRQPITDASGERLKGKAPYAHDPQRFRHYAHCKSQVEDCKVCYGHKINFLGSS
jgi:hypothetical protein